MLTKISSNSFTKQVATAACRTFAARPNGKTSASEHEESLTKPSVSKPEATPKFTDKFNSLLGKFTGQSTSKQAEGDEWLSTHVPPPKFYANSCKNHPLAHEYYEYEKSEVLFGPQDDFEFTSKLGRGRYSEVFRGVDLLNNQDVVIKILKPVKKVKVRREIKILDLLQGGPYIINLNNRVIDPSNRTPSLVFEYVENTDFRELYPKLTMEDIQRYMF